MKKMTTILLGGLLCVAACKNNETSTETTTTSVDTKPAAVASNPGIANGTKNADNTKLNDRDRHDTVTPTDQGNSKAETDITAAIRKGIIDDGSLSFDAKNAKVVTTGSKVTLRGPVKSDQERAAIEQLAKKTTGVSEVDNQLEVKK